MSLAPNRGSLITLVRDIALRWQQTKDYWMDAKSRQFESEYMERLSSSVDKTAEVIERLDKLLMRIRSDCE